MSWTITPGTVTTGTSGPATTSAPSGSGGILVLFVLREGAGSIDTPAGWTAREAAQDGFAATRLASFERVSDGGADDAPGVTMNATGLTSWQAAMLRLTGQAASSPWDADGSLTGTTGTSLALPTVTTAEAGEMLLGAISTPGADVTGGPAGWTAQVESEPAANTLAIWSKEAGAAGSYGGEAITTEFGGASVRLILAYKAAAVIARMLVNRGMTGGMSIMGGGLVG